MKQKLFHLYNRLKKSFVDEITDIVKHRKGEIIFNPHIRIDKPSDDGFWYDEVACLQFDEKEKTLYVHLQEIQVDAIVTEEHEYWISLRDLSFDEIYKIAEKI